MAEWATADAAARASARGEGVCSWSGDAVRVQFVSVGDAWVEI